VGCVHPQLLRLRREADAAALLLPAPLPNHDALARVQKEWLAFVVAAAPAAAMGLIETQLKAQNSQGLMPVRCLGELLAQLGDTDNPTVRLCTIHQKGTGFGVTSELASLSLQAHYAGQVAALQHVTLAAHSPPASELMAASVMRCLAAAAASTPGCVAALATEEDGSTSTVSGHHRADDQLVSGSSSDEKSRSTVPAVSVSVSAGADWLDIWYGEGPGDALFRAAALVIHHAAAAAAADAGVRRAGAVRPVDAPTCLRLLRLMCWAPVRTLTHFSVRAATCAWTWVLSAAPLLTVRTQMISRLARASLRPTRVCEHAGHGHAVSLPTRHTALPRSSSGPLREKVVCGTVLRVARAVIGSVEGRGRLGGGGVSG